MGKEDEAGRPVKREVVSASANLEVISEENFARRLQGMSACINCQKERYYGNTHSRNAGPRHQHNNNHHNSNSSNHNNNNNNSNKQGRRSKQGRRKQAKANTPIVIHLKDTLRSALQQRQRSFDTDSDVSVRSTDDDLGQDTFGDVSSIPEFIPQYLHQPQAYPHPHHHTGLAQPAVSSLSQRREKSKKNLTALISVIEKAHHKDSCHIESNLVGQNSNRSKFSHLLNNAVAFVEKGQAQQHRSIVECDNVDVICNDLHKNEKGGGEVTVEDTDSNSDKSSVASSSEVFSDSDSQMVEETAGFEFTSEELQRLAEYTTGYPIYRYDCAPSDCPECLSSWYSHQIYQYEGCTMDTAATHQSYSRLPRGRNRSSSHNESEHDTTLEGSDNEGETEGAEASAEYASRRGAEGRRHTSSTSSSHSYGQAKSTPSSPTGTSRDAVWPWRKAGRQLWDIDISQASRRSPGQDRHDNTFPNSVYLDLTGSDVSISIYYHHSLLQDDGVRNAIAASMMTPSVYATTTTSSLYSIYYSSYVASPVYGLSLPLSFFNDNALPKIAMVPPHELKKFSSSAPPARQWIVTQQADRSRPAATFTVMCYNVLCDKYCTRQQYGYCPTWALNWEYRKKGIIEDIRNLAADIISLQEVETDQFYHFFLPSLRQDGYDGIFSPKSRARTMTEQERKHVDGCAIFYKKEKFRLVEEKLVEFNQVAMANADGSDDMLNRVMTKDNIGLCALLETKPPIFDHGLSLPDPLTRQLILVATAHIHWDPEFSDVKMVQTMMLMWELQKLMEEATHKYHLPYPGPLNCNSIPFVFCGDLNSLPDSGVIEFLTNGKVAVNHMDFKDNLYEKAMKKMSNGDKTHIYHNFKLDRAYIDVMPVTNYTYDFKGIIDYIFFSQKRLRVLGQLGPYEEDWFRHNKVLGCPHPHIPSDHFSLMVELEMAIQPPPPMSRGPPPPMGNKPR
ncbi:uncharacterized protein [Littorina saxatilis]|uniref:uncharacterized protein n=1 Tax=Littorina saxatilis TaxID=31220 RepID=UPI0038B49E86